ncbi:AMP-binding protein [Micromonospora sp. HNM0581]|uniref:AMP-binding protein n=1 Tax=Micromonospora sp. HNM0581 TaxID=2716341 RepID=UPI0032179CC8
MRSFDATPAHKGLWLADGMSSATLNHALTMWDVAGALDETAITSAFRHVLDEAEILRVNFVDNGDGLRLVPRELGDWQPFFLDFSTSDDPEQAARDALAEMISQPFDVTRDLLFRLGVVRLATNRSLLVIAYHHLVADGYGAGGLLSRRLAEVYTALVRGHGIPPNPHRWDAESFAAMSTDYLASEQSAADAEFWRDYLKETPPPAQVPRIVVPDALRPALDAPVSSADRWAEVAGAIGMASRTLTVPRAEADAWAAAAESMGVWTSSMLTTAAAALLRHRCDLPEFLLSVATGNRSGSAGTTPGLAVNVVPVRIRVPMSATVVELADAIVENICEISGHTRRHYSDIQRVIAAAPSERGNFGVVMNVIDFVDQIHFADHPARYSGATTGSFTELSIGVYRDGTPDSDLFIRLDAAESLYTRAELRLIGEDLIGFIRAVAAAGGQPVGALAVTGDTEWVGLATTSDSTRTSDPTIADLFAERVARKPDAVALVAGESEISYRALDERSARVAAALRGCGVGPETVVAVAMPPSVDLAVALLGVVRSGAAYLPTEPGLPAEQLSSQLDNTEAGMLIVDVASAERLRSELRTSVRTCHDLEAEAAGGGGSTCVPGGGEAVPAHPDNAVAVTYGHASADPGTAVVVTHRNLARFALDRHWRRDSDDTVLWHTSPATDALALELWMPLLRGGRVVVAGQDGDALAEMRGAHRISVLWLSAELFCAVSAGRPDVLAGVREVWTPADQVTVTAVQRVRAACPGLSIVNGHGPVGTTTLLRARGGATEQRPPAAVAGLTDGAVCHVLGPGLAPVPAGVVGELYVAGSAVGRGYHRRPGHTAQRFVACPLGPAGGLMYRTGDRVRWGADGRLEYVGLAGGPARVGGVEVDVSHLEEVLAEHPRLARSCVAVGVDPTGRQRLVAYVVPLAERDATCAGSDGCRTDSFHEELSRFVAGRVPESLVPSAFVLLDRLPVTAGGRVDRTRLPEPDFRDGSYRAPRNHTEQVLAKLFADVLDLHRVGIDDDFFDLGGNSLRAIRLVGLIRAELHLEVSIRTLFAARTVAGLSQRWENLNKSSRPALRRRTKGGAIV